jgi:hypothetical protein
MVMHYRSETATDSGFESEEDERQAMRSFVQHALLAGDEGLMDTLLVCANICEQRSLMLSHDNPGRAEWLETTGGLLREILFMQSHGASDPKPNIKLEHPWLYFPDSEQMH